MAKFIDELFIILSKQLVDIHEKGLCESNSLVTKNKIVDDFLKLALDMSKQGYRPEIIDAELSFNISRHILNNDIDEVPLHAMEIIKNTLQAIISIDYSFLVSYSRYLCSDEVKHEIQYNIFNVFSDIENEKGLLFKNSIIDIMPRSGKDRV
ncbi:MAG: hypothetical protein K5986_03425 [Clostridium sp.]|uniref:hypothetical protein n=1 Tax=Clostridium sp. DSM 8431 TaxID=1761781 RepID=UPI0008E7EE37|nr:hypothetical protein [Clostridium sp. DSM 8431]MCR4943503.1 hypothetical protein [Clostridium sp.]SFU53094.1 hypothetical protein SAMN04487886_104914 [Clostridium sp. DSM 8431]